MDPLLRSALAVSDAPDQVRARIRKAFLDAAGSAAGESAGSSSPQAPGRLFRRQPRGGLRLVRVAVPLLATAAAVLALVLLRETRPSWRVLEVESATGVSVAGAHVAPADLEGLAQQLGDADGPLVNGEGELHLAYGDLFRLTAHPNSRFSPAGGLLASSPGEPLALELEFGEIHVRTLEGFPGQRLYVRTPDSEVVITGTTLGVLAQPWGTCVCVAEGHVEVRDLEGGESEYVTPLHSRITLKEAQGAMLKAFPKTRDPAAPADFEHVEELLHFAKSE